MKSFQICKLEKYVTTDKLYNYNKFVMKARAAKAEFSLAFDKALCLF